MLSQQPSKLVCLLHFFLFKVFVFFWQKPSYNAFYKNTTVSFYPVSSTPPHPLLTSTLLFPRSLLFSRPGLFQAWLAGVMPIILKYSSPGISTVSWPGFLLVSCWQANRVTMCSFSSLVMDLVFFNNCDIIMHVFRKCALAVQPGNWTKLRAHVSFALAECV